MDSDISIYTAPNGRKYDPLSLYRKLLIQSRNSINALLTDWQSSESDPLASVVAEEQLVALARSVFGLKGIEEEGQGGVTDRTVLNTLTHYLEFTEKKA